MDVFFIVLTLVLIAIGLIGSVLPVLPGPPLAMGGLLLLLFRPTYREMMAEQNYLFLITFTAGTALVTFLDFYLPVWGTKKFGGTEAGKRGSTIGMILGLFLLTPLIGPLSVIVSPFLGAVAGELIAGKDTTTAVRSGIGSFLGFLAGTISKLILCLGMLIYVLTLLF